MTVSPVRALLTSFVPIAAAVLVLSGGPISAQEAQPGDPAPAPAAPAHPKKPRAHAKVAHEAKPTEAKAAAPAPWAAVDPGRATGATPLAPDGSEAAVPGVPHVVQPDEDRYSVGMKWNSSNTPSRQDSTQGVFNEVAHDLGAPSAVGTDAEMGLKLHF